VTRLTSRASGAEAARARLQPEAEAPTSCTCRNPLAIERVADQSRRTWSSTTGRTLEAPRSRHNCAEGPTVRERVGERPVFGEPLFASRSQKADAERFGEAGTNARRATKRFRVESRPGLLWPVSVGRIRFITTHWSSTRKYEFPRTLLRPFTFGSRRSDCEPGRPLLNIAPSCRRRS